MLAEHLVVFHAQTAADAGYVSEKLAREFHVEHKRFLTIKNWYIPRRAAKKSNTNAPIPAISCSKIENPNPTPVK